MTPFSITQSSLNMLRGLAGSSLVHGCAFGVAMGWASLAEHPLDRARFAGERIVIHAVQCFTTSEAAFEPVTIVPVATNIALDAPTARELLTERTFPVDAMLPQLDIEETSETEPSHVVTRPAAVSKPENQAMDEPLTVPRVASTASAASAFQPPQAWGTDVPDQPANLSSSPLPRYPRDWKERGWAGTVLLRLHISAAGAIEQIEIVASSGFHELDASAISAVKHWKARPAQKLGKPVASQVNLPVVFDPGR
jgi:TonB family protein